MISSELRLLSTFFAETATEMVDDGSFAHLPCELIPLQMTLIHFLQRDVISNYLLEVETDWPWVNQPTRR